MCVVFSSHLLCRLAYLIGALHITVALHLISVITAPSEGSAWVAPEGVNQGFLVHINID